MFNPKISGIAAGIAFILSFLVGLISGSQFAAVLIRALIFGIVFFLLASVAYWLVTQFIPELLDRPSPEPSEINDSEVAYPGSRVDISVDSQDDPPAVQNGGSGPEMENFGGNSGNAQDNISGQGMDQKPEDDYNKGEEGYDPGSSQNPAEFAAVPSGDGPGQVDVLPDMESMSGFFTPSEEPGEESEVIGMEDDFPSASAPVSSRKKNTGASEDFNVQEMASAIQTILKRDQKG